MSSIPGATLRRVATIAIVFGAVFLGRAFVASAAEPDRHGYWQQGGIGAVGAPAVDVPAGGLLVSKGLADEAAVSAVARRVASGSVTSVVLVATESGGEGGVRACPATSAWSAPDGAGAWTDRPTHDCEMASVVGVNEGNTWRFDVGDLVADGVLDLVFVPTDSVAPFSIAFEAPSASTVQVTSSTPPVPPTPQAGPTEGSSLGAGAPPATFAPAPSSGFDPSPPAFAPTGSPPVDVAADSAPSATSIDGPTEIATPAADLGDVVGAASGPSGAALAVVTMTALATAGVWIRRRAHASAELAATHPLAGVPSLAGDSVRSAGRALVDDDSAGNVDQPAADVAMEMAR